MSSSATPSIPVRIFKLLSGFGLATTLLILLMVLTWLIGACWMLPVMIGETMVGWTCNAGFAYAAQAETATTVDSTNAGAILIAPVSYT